MSNPKGLPWRRFLAEGLLIIASVYIAVVLEGISDDRGQVEDARAALAQLVGELEADRADLAEIVEEQSSLDQAYDDLVRWLATPYDMPFDSVEATLDRVAYSNRTMFPRRGAWTTMVAGGHLAWIDDGELVSRLATFYETISDRLEYNGEDYDFSLNEVFRETAPGAWDFFAHRPVGEEADVRRLRSQLRYMSITWNQFYLDLLDEYEVQLATLIDQIHAYLGEGG